MGCEREGRGGEVRGWELSGLSVPVETGVGVRPGSSVSCRSRHDANRDGCRNDWSVLCPSQSLLRRRCWRLEPGARGSWPLGGKRVDSFTTATIATGPERPCG